MAEEKLTERPTFVPGVGWCNVIADRPYFDNLNVDTASNEDYRVAVRIETIPISEILKNGI